MARRLAQEIVGVNAVALIDARVLYGGVPLSSVGPERRLQKQDQEETPSSPPHPPGGQWTPVYRIRSLQNVVLPFSRGFFIAPRRCHDTDPPTTTNPPCK